MQFYLYAYINSKTGFPYYIGKGKDNRAFKSHGRIKVPKNRKYIVFMETNLTDIGALALERRYIRWYGREDNGSGILKNLTDGGDGAAGHKHTQEFKDKVSKWAKELPRTEKHYKKIASKLKGIKRSQESIDKMKKTKKDQNRPAWNKGITLTEEQKINMRKPKKKRITLHLSY